MPARAGVPQAPRPNAGRPLTGDGIDALLTRLERHIARLERQEERNPAMVRLLRVRVHLLSLRLAALDTQD